MTQEHTDRELLDSDGENRAVRAFLLLYGGTISLSVERMRDHLAMSGFNGCWPEWVNYPGNSGHLTKSGAQDWLRHLFSLETGAAEIGRSLKL